MLCLFKPGGRVYSVNHSILRSSACCLDKWESPSSHRALAFSTSLSQYRRRYSSSSSASSLPPVAPSGHSGYFPSSPLLPPFTMGGQSSCSPLGRSFSADVCRITPLTCPPVISSSISCVSPPSPNCIDGSHCTRICNVRYKMGVAAAPHIHLRVGL